MNHYLKPIAVATLIALATPAMAQEKADAGTTAAESATADKATTASAGKTLPSGTKIEDLVVGTGNEAKEGSSVLVHYVGTLTNGTEFDSSRKPGREPFLVENLGKAPVIKGWNEGIAGMKVGGKRKLTIPPAAAYGKRGFPPVIPPDSTLLFEVELLKVQ